MPQEKCLKRLLRLNILLKLYCYPSNHPLKDEIHFNHDKIKIKWNIPSDNGGSRITSYEKK